jgi:hypothetical protein
VKRYEQCSENSNGAIYIESTAKVLAALHPELKGEARCTVAAPMGEAGHIRNTNIEHSRIFLLCAVLRLYAELE